MQVTTCVDLASSTGAISFSINGRWLGKAYDLEKPQVRSGVHILLLITKGVLPRRALLPYPLSWGFAVSTEHDCLASSA